MSRFGAFAAAIAIVSATAAAAEGAAVTPAASGRTDTTAAESRPNAGAAAKAYPGAKPGQKKKTYMTPTANPLRTGDCSTMEMSGQAALNGQPMNGGASNPATTAGTGARATGQGINKGSGGGVKCWEERANELPSPQ
jgi:hypothetical protein